MRAPAYAARSPASIDEAMPGLRPVPSGIDVVHPAVALAGDKALFILNLVAGDRGLTPRPGTQEHATNVGSVAGEVRAVLPYHSSGALDRLFATAQNGLYDISAGGSAPTLKLTFGIQNTNTGFGESAPFVNSAGDRFLLYADEVNGYLLYTEGTDSWAAGSVTGVSPSALVHVALWGARVWFTERDSSRGWFLGLGAISGPATPFDFAPFFAAGGTLRGLWRWTRDGGQDGMGDHLVAVSSAGDVVVFRGTDPQYPNFQWVGTWHVGGVPAGRKLASQYGGDLQLLTLNGLLPLSRLVSGAVLTPDTYETNDIRPLFANAMAAMSTRRGWHVQAHPRGSFLCVNTPGVAGEPQEQFAMSFATRDWSRLRGLDILSSALWQGEFYFGTRDGRVLKSTGTVDNVLLGGNTSQAKAIECSWLPGFSNYGSGGRKAVRFLRLGFLHRGLPPSFEALVRFDLDTREPSGALEATIGSSGAWDVGQWDVALWGGGPDRTYRRIGATGVGTLVAVGAHFQASDYCVVTDAEVGIETGGPL